LPAPKKHQSQINKLKAWRKDQADAYRTYIKTSSVGLEFGLSIGIGALIGYFFDRHFKTAPYGLLIGVIIGSIAAAKRLYLFVKSYLKKNESDDE
jgi:F0F1-type ATP synthase assembly protein I